MFKGETKLLLTGADCTADLGLYLPREAPGQYPLPMELGRWVHLPEFPFPGKLSKVGAAVQSLFT